MRTYYLVTRPGDSAPFLIFDTPQHAAAVRAVKEIEFPSIGPWGVIELREVSEGERYARDAMADSADEPTGPVF